MSDLILPSATAALAYKRLVEASDQLRRKITSTRYEPVAGFGVRAVTEPVTINEVERRVLGLAEAARDSFRAGETATYADRSPIPPGLSRFAFLGATSFHLVQEAELFGTPQPWLASAMRRGTGDPNRSHVHVPSTDFALAAANQALTRASADERPAIRAYAMGLTAATAGAVLTSPSLRGVAEARNRRAWTGERPAGLPTAGLHRALFGATPLSTLLPASTAVPEAVHDGYLAALEEVYGFPSNRPPGFGSYEEGFVDGEAITAERLRSAQSFLINRTATADWGGGTWYLVLLPGLVAVPLGLLVARFLPTARHFFEAGQPGERGAYELLTTSMGLGSIGPLAWSMYLWSQFPEHQGTFVEALVLGILRVGLTTASLATNHLDLPAAARWAGLWLPLQLTDLYALIRGIIHVVNGNGADAFVHLLNTFPSMVGLTSLGLAGLMELLDLSDDVAWWIVWGLLALLFLTVPGILLARFLARNNGVAPLFADRAELPALDHRTQGFESAPPVKLFDESTLWPDGDGPGLTDLRYPTQARGLVRIWWPEDSALEVAHDRHRVRFRIDGGTPIEVVLGPGGLTATTVAERLRTALPGLMVEVVDDEPDAATIPLPFPATLDDPGDEAASHVEHDLHRDDFLGVGAEPESAYVIRQTPQAELTSSYGLFGPSASPLVGLPLLPDASLANLDDSAVGLAADLAALLCLGTGPSLDGETVGAATAAGLAPVADDNDPVHQVFRRWNLDDRRINEWRMLVAGGASTEKTSPEAYDEGMRAHPNPGSYASPSPGGEALANTMGWVPLWRSWLRMAADPSADTVAGEPHPATPFVARRGEVPRQPTNLELSDAMRFLLDLP